ncbi:MAG TPA: DUF6206 family protein [Candidatus Nitrosotenuis sp.]|nr:DUF6206 family protein [Candidatus Nitrosotenuis sp.]
MSELRRLPLEGARFGFFCRPFLAASGPHAGKVLKLYRGGRREEAEALAQAHRLYVDKLRRLGILVPPTTMEVLAWGRGYRVQIVQEPFPIELHARTLVQRGEPAAGRAIVRGILEDALKVIGHNQATGEEIGFHPTLRNYFVRDSRFFMVDTFPPMAGGRRQVKAIVAAQVGLGGAGPLGDWLMDLVTEEYYDPLRMLFGVLASAARLRPELAEDFFAQARQVFEERATGEMRQLLLEEGRKLRLSRQHFLVRLFKRQ